MRHLEGKVAFITGGGSGIGLGVAKACVRHGMKVVIADKREGALDEAMACFKSCGHAVHPVRLDVTDRDAYVRAADEAETVFGRIHLLILNAGVGGGGSVQNMTYRDWDYTVSVNLGGVINGVVTILPRILRHGEEGHVVATSSTNGIAATGVSITYCTTKFAVAGMMEALATELQGTRVGASVLVPGPTMTDLGRTTAENRPPYLVNEGGAGRAEGRSQPKPRDPCVWMDPEETGERVIRGIKNNDLFIITHPEFKTGFEARFDAIVRACPREVPDPKRWDILKTYGTVIYNDIYDRQKQVGPPDW
jgi:NAD(P)-dependent dehydrogenase (short-subunit alcohol dehydrogenase family)